ncbi:MAG: TIGR01459 family HAD-type hydrolase [Rhodobacteraceae bacterium]|nr:TIGR01459 family HAD-type hydrolase [Paracoccaceae bacterium]
MSRIIERFGEVAHQFDALFFDVWGCLHNGLTPYPRAVSTLCEFTRNGGLVVLLTNSPRRSHVARLQLRDIGVSERSWNLLVTSGDAAATSLFSGDVGRRVFHIGTRFELGFFESSPGDFWSATEIERVSIDEAEGVVCTGPFLEDRESAEVYLPLLHRALNRSLPMLCANPDIHVDRGSQREICAGAIAQAYESIGGEVLLFGKPRKAIYDLALAGLRKLVPGIARQRILCVGDGISTDILGATRNGFPALFVTGGLAAAETGTLGRPDRKLLGEFLASQDIHPEYSIGHFR